MNPLTHIVDWIVKNSNDHLDREDIVWGFAMGLLCGFACGLVVVLAGCLIGGIALGFGGGLVVVLAVGLLWGCVRGFAAGFAAGFGSLISTSLVAAFTLPVVWWHLLIAILIIGELIFLLSNSKRKAKESWWLFTLKRKAKAIAIAAFLTAAFLTIEACGIYRGTKEFFPWFELNKQLVVKWFGYIGIGLMGIAAAMLVVYLWLALNYYLNPGKVERRGRRKR